MVILEDKRSCTFAAKTLKVLGYEKRDYRVRVAPPGKGAGEKCVRDWYIDEVKAYRKECNHQNIGLLTVIDADTKTVEQRKLQLDEELRSRDLPVRAVDERISLWIPKRHVETWLVSLCGGDVDEETDTKRQRPRVDIQQAAKVFKELFDRQKREPVEALPSIQIALQETMRILE